MNSSTDQGSGASVPDQALAVPVEPVTRLDPSGFDPSRWQTSRFRRLLDDLQAEGSELALRAARCIDDLADSIEGLCYQFAGHSSKDGEAAIWTMGLSDLEGAFDLLGWPDPHPTPDVTCDEPGCDQWSTCGTPTPEGYRRTCYKHSPHAIATEARRAETPESGSVHEGAGPKDIAQGESHD